MPAYNFLVMRINQDGSPYTKQKPWDSGNETSWVEQVVAKDFIGAATQVSDLWIAKHQGSLATILFPVFLEVVKLQQDRPRVTERMKVDRKIEISFMVEQMP